MKKVKIMITAITILAVVGGALAFKAKTFSQTCYLSSNAPTITCPAIDLGTTTGGIVGDFTYATATAFDQADFQDCTAQQNVQKLPCEDLVRTHPESN